MTPADKDSCVWILGPLPRSGKVKLASWRLAGRKDFGLVLEDGLLPLRERLPGRQGSLREALASGVLGELGAVAREQPPTLGTDQVEFLPLIHDPTKFLAIGLNYQGTPKR